MSELNWRRQWKPDLLSCPWRCLGADNNLFIKANFLADSYEVLVTDLAHFWHEECPSESSLKRRISVSAELCLLEDELMYWYKMRLHDITVLHEQFRKIYFSLLDISKKYKILSFIFFVRMCVFAFVLIQNLVYEFV